MKEKQTNFIKEENESLYKIVKEYEENENCCLNSRKSVKKPERSIGKIEKTPSRDSVVVISQRESFRERF